MTHNEIVIGLDDSPSAKAALRWAAQQAIHRQIVLRAIHVFDLPYGSSDPNFAAGSNADLSFDATQARHAASITKLFDDISPRPDWLMQFATGEPGPVLVRQSRESQLLVVGTREHVGLGRLLSGSVSHYCVGHADCPVVAVPRSPDAGQAELLDQDVGSGSKVNEIVVGVDPSPSARAALRWAAEQARATGQSLRAVRAVDISQVFNLALGLGRVAVPMQTSALDTSQEAITAIFDSVQPEPGWRLQFFSGEAGPVLVSESNTAALLVVGTREHVGIGRLFSGSVSHYSMSHVQCPVVAVPASADQDQDQDQAATHTAAHD